MSNISVYFKIPALAPLKRYTAFYTIIKRFYMFHKGAQVAFFNFFRLAHRWDATHLSSKIFLSSSSRKGLRQTGNNFLSVRQCLEQVSRDLVPLYGDIKNYVFEFALALMTSCGAKNHFLVFVSSLTSSK